MSLPHNSGVSPESLPDPTNVGALLESFRPRLERMLGIEGGDLPLVGLCFLLCLTVGMAYTVGATNNPVNRDKNILSVIRTILEGQV